MGYVEGGKGKYYYLRLKENFFDSEEIQLLETGENGLEYSSFLLKLYCKSLKQEGRLTLNELVPYDAEMLATVTRCSVEFVEKALKKLKRLGLIEVLDDGVIYMLDIQNFIGKSSDMADRMRDYRARIEGEKYEKEAQKERSGQMPDKCITNVTTNVQHLRDRDRDRDRNRDRDRDRVIDEDQKIIVNHLNKLLGYSDHTGKFLSYFKKEDWPKLIKEIEGSDWLKENLNREQEPKAPFIAKILNGGYKTYSKPKQAKNDVINNQTSKYSGDDLDAMARRKWAEARKKGQNSTKQSPWNYEGDPDDDQ